MLRELKAVVQCRVRRAFCTRNRIKNRMCKRFYRTASPAMARRAHCRLLVASGQLILGLMLLRFPPMQDTRYFMGYRGESCDDHCKQKGMMCRGQGGFPSGNARAIYQQLGVACKRFSKYIYQDNPGYGITRGVCYGAGGIPAAIHCSAGDNPALRRLCPCKNPSTYDRRQRER